MKMKEPKGNKKNVGIFREKVTRVRISGRRNESFSPVTLSVSDANKRFRSKHEKIKLSLLLEWHNGVQRINFFFRNRFESELIGKISLNLTSSIFFPWSVRQIFANAEQDLNLPQDPLLLIPTISVYPNLSIFVPSFTSFSKLLSPLNHDSLPDETRDFSCPNWTGTIFQVGKIKRGTFTTPWMCVCVPSFCNLGDSGYCA